MAALATAQTILNKWTGLGPSSKFNPYGVNRTITYYQVQLVLSTQGGPTNNIPATLIGSLGTILGCTSAVKSDNSIINPAGPSADGTLLLIGLATSGVPTDTSGTFNLIVWGYDNITPTVTGSTDGDQS